MEIAPGHIHNTEKNPLQWLQFSIVICNVLSHCGEHSINIHSNQQHKYNQCQDKIQSKEINQTLHKLNQTLRTQTKSKHYKKYY